MGTSRQLPAHLLLQPAQVRVRLQPQPRLQRQRVRVRQLARVQQQPYDLQTLSFEI